ncbi:MAG: hypothetical protein OXN89_23945 [Bryobacterales bacterium]|nr:hypothetical protein [Bryobacterales bacterium]MDE0105440.1 hypothetical protein [Bryobacterales bacterium]
MARTGRGLARGNLRRPFLPRGGLDGRLALQHGPIGSRREVRQVVGGPGGQLEAGELAAGRERERACPESARHRGPAALRFSGVSLARDGMMLNLPPR